MYISWNLVTCSTTHHACSHWECRIWFDLLRLIIENREKLDPHVHLTKKVKSQNIIQNALHNKIAPIWPRKTSTLAGPVRFRQAAEVCCAPWQITAEEVMNNHNAFWVSSSPSAYMLYTSAMTLKMAVRIPLRVNQLGHVKTHAALLEILSSRTPSPAISQ